MYDESKWRHDTNVVEFNVADIYVWLYKSLEISSFPTLYYIRNVYNESYGWRYPAVRLFY